MTSDEFFSGRPQSKKLFAAITCEIEAIGKATTRITKSQIAFRRRHTFAAVWMPALYLKAQSAPLVQPFSCDIEIVLPDGKKLCSRHQVGLLTTWS